MFDDTISYGSPRIPENNPVLSRRDPAKLPDISLAKPAADALIKNGCLKVNDFRNSKNKPAYACPPAPHGVEE